jgi:glycosyltransferase involved in cell wall biosynthesis
MVPNLVAIVLHLWPGFRVRFAAEARRREVLAWIDSKKPTHLVLEHPHFTGLIPTIKSRGIKILVDCQNVESDLARQFIGSSYSDHDIVQRVLKWLTMTRLEQFFFPKADEIWLPSEIDAAKQRLVCKYKITTRCVPNALDISQYPLRDDIVENSIVLTASYGYPPNLEAATILRDIILPIIRESLHDVRLILVGWDPHGHAKALERPPEVTVTGRVPDTKPYIRKAGVCAVPILNGGGTRYKILEALALGRPVVSTPLGAEGLDLQDGVHLFIRPIEQFAEAIIYLLKNPVAANDLGSRGRELVLEKYSWEAIERIVRRSLLGT